MIIKCRDLRQRKRLILELERLGVMHITNVRYVKNDIFNGGRMFREHLFLVVEVWEGKVQWAVSQNSDDDPFEELP